MESGTVYSALEQYIPISLGVEGVGRSVSRAQSVHQRMAGEQQNVGGFTRLITNMHDMLLE